MAVCSPPKCSTSRADPSHRTSSAGARERSGHLPAKGPRPKFALPHRRRPRSGTTHCYGRSPVCFSEPMLLQWQVRNGSPRVPDPGAGSQVPAEYGTFPDLCARSWKRPGGTIVSGVNSVRSGRHAVWKSLLTEAANTSIIAVSCTLCTRRARSLTSATRSFLKIKSEARLLGRKVFPSCLRKHSSSPPRHPV